MSKPSAKPVPTSRTPRVDVSAPCVSPAERWIVVLLLLAGLLLRLGFPGRMAVEHFDEGVYASNLWFDEEELFQYPDRHLYAPPLLSWIIEWSLVLFGPSSLAAMTAGLAAGGLTPALAWWTARRWFGVEAGLAAAALAAFSDFHLLYSRTALTDALLVAWMLPAVFCFWKSCTAAGVRPRLAWAAASGVLTGLAWWTKYNGWLPLAIGAAGVIAWLIVERRGPAEARRCLLSWLTAAAVAAAVWSPVLGLLPGEEGYAAVARNHRQYLVGWDGWLAGLKKQAAAQRHFEGWLSCAGVGLAVLLAAVANRWLRDRFTWNAAGETASAGPADSKTKSSAAPADSGSPISGSRGAGPIGRRSAGLLALMAAALAAVLGSSVTLAVFAVAGVLIVAIGDRPGRKQPDQQRSGPQPSEQQSAEWERSGRALAAWLTAAWFGGLLLVTPLYHPYPRLTLPWLAAAWLGAAAAIGWMVHRLGPVLNQAIAGSGLAPTPQSEGPADRPAPSEAAPLPRALRWLPGACCLLAAVVLIGSADRLTPRGIPGWQPRTGMETAAEQVIHNLRQLTGETPAGRSAPVAYVVYVYAEPGLFFHLARLSETGIAQPAGNLGFAAPGQSPPEIPTFLAAGPHAWRSGEFAREWQQVGERFELVATYPSRPSDLVLFDRVGRDINGGSEDDVRLYRLR